MNNTNTFTLLKYLFCLVVYSLFLTGCSQERNNQPDIAISSAYIREAPPGKQVTVAYMELLNRRLSSCHLTGANAEFASSLEIHQHLHEKGMMQMRKVDSLELPPGIPVLLGPGGYHLMIFGLKQPLIPEQEYAITLRFSDCQPITTHAIVKRIMDN